MRRSVIHCLVRVPVLLLILLPLSFSACRADDNREPYSSSSGGADTNRALKVATCQFAVGASIQQNGIKIREHIRSAKQLGADVVHFPEYALCGYPGKDFESWAAFDWEELRRESEKIAELAGTEKVWVIMGSAHRLSDDHLPHNSLYVIDPLGTVVERYDKRFCSSRELANFTPGDHFSIFYINGVRCGLLICNDSRFPEVYREYRKREVDLIFQSFHIARAPGPGVLSSVIPATLQTRAASNYFWISAPNSSAYFQTFPSLFIQPDGAIIDSVAGNSEGIMVHEVNMDKQYYDASKPFRGRAMSGLLNSRDSVNDPRSRERTTF